MSNIRSLIEIDDDGWPPLIDLAELAKRVPQPPRVIVHGFPLPEGEVTLLGGHGGAGKSAIALHGGVCIALGMRWHGFATERRRVLYVSAEDPETVLHWRLSRICAHLGVSMEALVGHLELLDLAAVDAELMVESREGREAVLASGYSNLRNRMRGVQVVILDSASDLYGANEITRRQVRRYIRMLRLLIPRDGAALLLAHVDKAAARGKESKDYYSGSTQWHNSVRARWALREDGDGLVLSVEKCNHGKAGSQFRLKWDPAAHMHLADGAHVDGGIVGEIHNRTDTAGILAAMADCAAANEPVPAATQGQRTAYHVLRAQPSFPPDLGADTRAARRRFWSLIERLRQLGTVKEGEIRAANRRFVGTLELSQGASEGERAN